MSKYVKITREILLTKMISLAAEPTNFIGGCINICNLSYLLKTSKYQVRKFMKELKEDELVKLTMISNWNEDENIPPYWGWILTEKGRELEEYKKKSKENVELLKECFAI